MYFIMLILLPSDQNVGALYVASQRLRSQFGAGAGSDDFKAAE